MIYKFLATLAVFAMTSAGASAATYTVSPSGNDSNSGSSAAPFRTITRAAQVAKTGDTVNVTPGVYEETVPLTAANSGATFRGVGQSRPVIQGGRERARGFDNTGANGITIENFEITGQTTAGIFTAGSNNTISGNVIHHIGSASIRETQGIRVNRGANNRVAGNTIHHIGPGAGSIGIWLLESRAGIVEDNTTYLIRKEGMRDWKGLDNVLRRNRSFLNWVGISLNTTTGATVVDNLLYENTQGLQLKHLSYSTVLDYWGLSVGKWSRVTHNTVFRSTDASAWIAQSGSPLDYLELTDNAFSGAGTAFLRDRPSLRGPHVIVDRNAYSDVGGKPRYVYKADYSSDPGVLVWDSVRTLLGWELETPPSDAGARGVGVAEPSWTPYKMTPVDSSSQGTYYTRTHLDKTSDNVQNTYWLTAGNTNEYVSFDFGQHRTFDHLQLTIYSHEDLRNPRRVRFEVWDGTAWRVIHEITNPDPEGSAYYYELAAPVTAQFLKMTLIDTFCSASGQCGEYFVVSDLEAGLLGSDPAPEREPDPERDPEPAPNPEPDPEPGPAPEPGPDPVPTETTSPTAPLFPRALRLDARAYRVKRARMVELRWNGAVSRRVDIYRGGVKVATTANDGAHTVRMRNARTSKRKARYMVCEAGTATCSKKVTSR